MQTERTFHRLPLFPTIGHGPTRERMLRLSLSCATVLALLAAVPAAAQRADSTAAQHADTTVALPPLPAGQTASAPTYTPKVGGYIQARETYEDGPGLTATLNRVRLSVEGPMPEHFSYRLMAEYAASSATSPAGVSLRDAFIRWADGKWSATAGQYKTPFSREYLMSISTLETPNRARLENLGPKRDIGVMAEYVLEPDLRISAGVFNGEGQNASFNRDSTVMFVGRIVARPLPHLSVGASGTASGDDSTRIQFEAGVDFGGFALRGEYVRLERDGDDTRDEGWYGLATYRVAGGLSLALRQEAIDRRLGAPELTKLDATTAGAWYDFAGGKMRAWLDWEHATPLAGDDIDTVIAQLQVRF